VRKRQKRRHAGPDPASYMGLRLSPQ